MGINNKPEYLDIFRENGKRIAAIRDELVELAERVNTKEAIEQRANELIDQAGGEPAFKKHPGYKWATCICVNDCLVHGVPEGEYEEGDLLTIDVGMSYQGTTTDVATTFVVGRDVHGYESFLNVGRKTMRKAIRQAKVGNVVKDISEKLQSIPESAGYSVTRNLVGHGLGKTMHEPPSIPCFVSDDSAMQVKLEEGMVITIEAMYMEGDWPLRQGKDGWSLFTQDGSIAAMLEEDILITQDGPELLSQGKYSIQV